MELVFIGCDPGVHGAVAAIGPQRTVLLVEKFPIIKLAKAPVRRMRVDRETGESKKTTVHGVKTEFDFFAMAGLFDQIVQFPGAKIAVVEQVGATPRDARSAAFTFGGSFWAIRQALADRGIPYETVLPRTWQREALEAMPHGDRNALVLAYMAKARTLFPSVDLSKKTHADMAAALLIAEYARRMFNSEKILR